MYIQTHTVKHAYTQCNRIRLESWQLEKCQKHGVKIAEIESVFRQTMAVFPDPTHSQGEDRFIGIGKTNQGRSVFIAFTLRTHSDDVLIRPISTRYMHQKEVEHYEKEISKTQNR